MPAASLPDRPHLDQLRRQAKELRDAARAGDPTARERIRTHTGDAGAASLATAQLTIAREHGFASWPQLKTEIEHRIVGWAQRVRELLEASVREPMQADAGLRNERAARLLAADPGIARHDIRTAAVLGEAGRMRELLAEDPGLAVHPDPATTRTRTSRPPSKRSSTPAPPPTPPG